MKITRVLSLALAGAAVLALASHTARATLSYSAGDLFLGFHGTGAAQDYLVNIGNVSQFASLSAGSTVTVNTGGSISGDLNTAFGSSWFSSGSVFWSITGTTYNGTSNLTSTLYATKPRSNPASQSVPWRGRSNSGQVESVSLLQALAGKYVQDGTAAGTPTATLQDSTAKNSYADLTSGASDFSIGGSVEGKTTATLDFYQINPVDDQAATYLGYFTLNSNGVVTFTAVPEPSVFVLMGLSASALLIFRRRSIQKALQS
jgi:hypothetical protein